MTTRIIENSHEIVVNFQSGEIVKPDCIEAAGVALSNACQLAIKQAKPLHFDLRGIATLSAAAIGRFVQVGRRGLDAKLHVQFLIPPELDGMFRILHLHNLFDVQVTADQLATNDAESATAES